MGGRPSTIQADIKVPFARPRHFTMGETAEFNELCAALREEVTKARETQAVRDSAHG
jgi:ABC-type nitrate/sulfonate/bicarbonate transport system ATPase subunit